MKFIFTYYFERNLATTQNKNNCSSSTQKSIRTLKIEKEVNILKIQHYTCTYYTPNLHTNRNLFSEKKTISQTFVTAHGRSNISLGRKGICRENDKQP